MYKQERRLIKQAGTVSR